MMLITIIVLAFSVILNIVFNFRSNTGPLFGIEFDFYSVGSKYTKDINLTRIIWLNSLPELISLAFAPLRYSYSMVYSLSIYVVRVFIMHTIQSYKI